MADTLNANVLGGAGAIVSAACMLLLGLFAKIGIYTGAANAMQAWHMFFDLTPLGIFTGMIEAAIISYVLLWLLAWTYNKMV